VTTVVHPGARLRVQVVETAVVAPDVGPVKLIAVQFYFVILFTKLGATVIIGAVAGDGKEQFSILSTIWRRERFSVYFAFYILGIVAIAEATGPCPVNTEDITRRNTFNKVETNIC